MAWDRNRYYSRSRRQNGRVVRHYIGIGSVAIAAAAEDAQRRAERDAARAAWKAAKARQAALAAPFKVLDELVSLLSRAILLRSGLKRHGGQWRRPRKYGRNPSRKAG